MRVRLTLSYDGSAFSGFQVQKNAESVQHLLCEALATVCKAPIPVSGCSRTDAGVHARTFVCHADLPCDSLPPRILTSLNALLPDTIAVSEITEVSENFHARYSATGKTYRYYFTNAPVRDPLSLDRALQVKAPLDLEKMKEAATALLGTHDFAVFQAAGSKVKDTVRTVTQAEFVKTGAHTFYFEITANGFLYRMVRNIVGTLLDIGLGKDYDIPALLNSKDRTKAGKCAPPHALYLWQVHYD